MKLIVGKKFTFVVGTISIGFFLIKAYFAAGIKGSLATAAVLALLFLTVYADGRNRAGRPLIGPKAARAIRRFWWGTLIVSCLAFLLMVLLITTQKHPPKKSVPDYQKWINRKGGQP